MQMRIWVALYLCQFFGACSIEPVLDRRGHQGLAGEAKDLEAQAPVDRQATQAAGLYDAFSESMHPYLQESSCSQCHGSEQSPFFAAYDSELAFQQLVDGRKVDLQNPNSSRLVRRLRDDQHMCWDDCDDNASEMLGQIETWLSMVGEGQRGEGEGFRKGIITDALMFTDAVANGSTGLLQYQIGDALFVVEVAEFDEFSLVFKNPQVVFEEGQLQIAGVRLLVNDVEDSQLSTFANVDLLLDAPGGEVSSAAMIVPLDQGLGVDTFSFAFATFEEFK